jgi:hypothetical protein
MQKTKLQALIEFGFVATQCTKEKGKRKRKKEKEKPTKFCVGGGLYLDHWVLQIAIWISTSAHAALLITQLQGDVWVIRLRRNIDVNAVRMRLCSVAAKAAQGNTSVSSTE